jgi:hypothetical protein
MFAERLGITLRQRRVSRRKEDLMMGQGPIIYIDYSEVREGKLTPLKETIRGLTDFVQAHEPQIIAYNVYFSADGKYMNVVHIHHGSSSLETHLRVAGPEFPKFADYIRLLSIDIYGNPGDSILEQLRSKARLLGAEAVNVHDFHAGFARFGSRETWEAPIL